MNDCGMVHTDAYRGKHTVVYQVDGDDGARLEHMSPVLVFCHPALRVLSQCLVSTSSTLAGVFDSNRGVGTERAIWGDTVPIYMCYTGR